MRTEQRVLEGQAWSGPATLSDAQLVLAFGGRGALSDANLAALARDYPHASLIGCSTAGEIAGTRVRDDSISATAVRFDRSKIRAAHIDLAAGESSGAAGKRLAQQVPKDGLVHVMVFSDGQHVNGSQLVEGMMGALPRGVQVTGGLAGDGARFKETFTVVGHTARPGRIAAIGFYGPIKVGYGSLGGWDPFGPTRRITRSEGNVLFELDGQPALALYKRYLGDHVSGLPATGLLFPLSVQVAPDQQGAAPGPELVRTILAVDDAAQSMTFAGDMPQGGVARLMKANFDRLVDGAHGAAAKSTQPLDGNAELAILISCVGRKLVLKQRVEEEIEAVRGVLGPNAMLAGFYSYGEICPTAPGANCALHNQTMTITTFREA